MDRTVPAAVEQHAKATPDALAIERDGEQLSYRELNSRANRVARELLGRGARRGSVVGVHLGRSAEWVIAVLGVLKAGAVCMSLDPKAPAERTARAIAAARPVAVLTGRRDGGTPPEGAPVILLDTLAAGPEDEENPGVELRPEDLAFAMHTSGSSGRAKIVLAQHSWLSEGVRRGVAVNRTTAADRGSWLAPAGAGIAVHEVCMLLWAGASIHICEPDVVASPVDLRVWLLDHAITQTFVITPVGEALQALEWPADGPLRLMTLGGDKLNSWAPPGLPFEVAVSYGSLEAFQIANSLHPWETRRTPATATAADRAAPPPVGEPLPGVGVHLLEEDLTPVEPGAIGEVWVDSPSLSLGYLGDPATTADRFRPNPFGEPGSRLYRSGDAGRLRADGILEHHGRIDDVVKIRGHRVEVGEVEWALAGHSAVRQVAVVGAREEAGPLQLVACLVTDGSAEPRELRAWAVERLQDFMVPVAYVLLDRLPVNTSNKIDRLALPPQGWQRWRPAGPYRAPEGEHAVGLAELFTELLAVERVGADDDFFELGGDSLLAAQLQTRIGERFGVRLGLEDLMGGATPAELAEQVARAAAAGAGIEQLAPITPRTSH
ncbi:non-ribosomal peptide synthetase [Kitasatospora sp. NPDC059673]|uniref:non-ribosomal peptide synthetase n=1 Tax=Kitasatospora sp. NPDC059673 TaxID=3346901 RepID=UPI0036B4B95C